MLETTTPDEINTDNATVLLVGLLRVEVSNLH